jgi:hypothetical protein
MVLQDFQSGASLLLETTPVDMRGNALEDADDDNSAATWHA